MTHDLLPYPATEDTGIVASVWIADDFSFIYCSASVLRLRRFYSEQFDRIIGLFDFLLDS